VTPAAVLGRTTARFWPYDERVTGLQACVGFGIAALNLAYWWMVVRRGDAWFRQWCERRFDVTITLSFRGHWRVVGGTSSRVRRFAIEWLPLAYYVAAMVVWGAAMTLAFLALSHLD